jgi:hypothetical protein
MSMTCILHMQWYAGSPQIACEKVVPQKSNIFLKIIFPYFKKFQRNIFTLGNGCSYVCMKIVTYL